MRKRFTEKLAEKLADVKNAFGRSKIAKRVATLSLAAGMLLPVAFAASGCQVIIRDPNNPDKDIVVDINPGTNPGDGDNKDPNEPSKEPDYSMYSPTLQTVLKSEYYNDLIEKLSSGKGTTSSHFDADYNLCESIPYRFLSEHGENISEIKNNAVRVSSTPYFMNDDYTTLYNKVDLTFNNGDNNYIKQYLLRYDNISEQEFNEMKMLYQNKYYQAELFVQELDNQRDAVLLSEFSIYENTYNTLLGILNSADVITSVFDGKKIDNYTIFNAQVDSENAKYLNFSIYITSKDNEATVSNRQIAQVDLRYIPQSNYSLNGGILSAKDAAMVSLVEKYSPVSIIYFNMVVDSNLNKNFIK